MQSLASGVGDLKKVLTNVKTGELENTVRSFWSKINREQLPKT
jgi:hypothetical protein